MLGEPDLRHSRSCTSSLFESCCEGGKEKDKDCRRESQKTHLQFPEFWFWQAHWNQTRWYSEGSWKVFCLLVRSDQNNSYLVYDQNYLFSEFMISKFLLLLQLPIPHHPDQLHLFERLKFLKVDQAATQINRFACTAPCQFLFLERGPEKGPKPEHLVHTSTHSNLVEAIPALIVTSFIPEDLPMKLPSTSNLTDVPFARQLSIDKKSKCKCRNLECCQSLPEGDRVPLLPWLLLVLAFYHISTCFTLFMMLADYTFKKFFFSCDKTLVIGLVETFQAERLCSFDDKAFSI